MLFFVDVVVLALSVAVFRNIETGLYGMISIYTSAKVLDGILYGLDTGKVLLVISERHREIADRVMKQLERGVTFLQGAGAPFARRKGMQEQV